METTKGKRKLAAESLAKSINQAYARKGADLFKPATPEPVGERTPTPWLYEPSTKTIRSVPANYWLATMDSWDGAVNNDANAAFIVTAVNNHQALVDALKALLKSFNIVPEEWATVPSVSFAIADARAALAAIEGSGKR